MSSEEKLLNWIASNSCSNQADLHLESFLSRPPPTYNESSAKILSSPCFYTNVCTKESLDNLLSIELNSWENSPSPGNATAISDKAEADDEEDDDVVCLDIPSADQKKMCLENKTDTGVHSSKIIVPNACGSSVGELHLSRNGNSSASKELPQAGPTSMLVSSAASESEKLQDCSPDEPYKSVEDFLYGETGKSVSVEPRGTKIPFLVDSCKESENKSTPQLLSLNDISLDSFGANSNAARCPDISLDDQLYKETAPSSYSPTQLNFSSFFHGQLKASTPRDSYADMHGVRNEEEANNVKSVQDADGTSKTGHESQSSMKKCIEVIDISDSEDSCDGFKNENSKVATEMNTFGKNVQRNWSASISKERVMPLLIPLSDTSNMEENNNESIEEPEAVCPEVIDVPSSPEMPRLIPFTSETEEPPKCKPEGASEIETSRTGTFGFNLNGRQPVVLLHRLTMPEGNLSQKVFLEKSSDISMCNGDERCSILSVPEIDVIDDLNFYSFHSKQEMDSFCDKYANNLTFGAADVEDTCQNHEGSCQNHDGRNVITPSKTHDITQIKGWRTKQFIADECLPSSDDGLDIESMDADTNAEEVKTDVNSVVQEHDAIKDAVVDDKPAPSENSNSNPTENNDCKVLETPKEDPLDCKFESPDMKILPESLSEIQDTKDVKLESEPETKIEESEKKVILKPNGIYLSDALESFLKNDSKLMVPYLEETNPNITPIPETASILSVGNLRKVDPQDDTKSPSKRSFLVEKPKGKNYILNGSNSQNDVLTSFPSKASSKRSSVEKPKGKNSVLSGSNSENDALASFPSKKNEDEEFSVKYKAKKKSAIVVASNKVLKKTRQWKKNKKEVPNGQRLVLRLKKEKSGVSLGYKIDDISSELVPSRGQQTRLSSSDMKKSPHGAPAALETTPQSPVCDGNRSKANQEIIKDTKYSPDGKRKEDLLLSEFLRNMNLLGTRSTVTMLVRSKQAYFEKQEIMQENFQSLTNTHMSVEQLTAKTKEPRKKARVKKASPNAPPVKRLKPSDDPRKESTGGQPCATPVSDCKTDVHSEGIDSSPISRNPEPRLKRSIRPPLRYLDSAVLADSDWVSPSLVPDLLIKKNIKKNFNQVKDDIVGTSSTITISSISPAKDEVHVESEKQNQLVECVETLTQPSKEINSASDSECKPNSSASVHASSSEKPESLQKSACSASPEELPKASQLNHVTRELVTACSCQNVSRTNVYDCVSKKIHCRCSAVDLSDVIKTKKPNISSLSALSQLGLHNYSLTAERECNITYAEDQILPDKQHEEPSSNDVHHTDGASKKFTTQISELKAKNNDSSQISEIVLDLRTTGQKEKSFPCLSKATISASASDLSAGSSTSSLKNLLASHVQKPLSHDVQSNGTPNGCSNVQKNHTSSPLLASLVNTKPSVPCPDKSQTQLPKVAASKPNGDLSAITHASVVKSSADCNRIANNVPPVLVLSPDKLNGKGFIDKVRFASLLAKSSSTSDGCPAVVRVTSSSKFMAMAVEPKTNGVTAHHLPTVGKKAVKLSELFFCHANGSAVNATASQSGTSGGMLLKDKPVLHHVQSKSNMPLLLSVSQNIKVADNFGPFKLAKKIVVSTNGPSQPHSTASTAHTGKGEAATDIGKQTSDFRIENAREKSAELLSVTNRPNLPVQTKSACTEEELVVDVETVDDGLDDLRKDLLNTSGSRLTSSLFLPENVGNKALPVASSTSNVVVSSDLSSSDDEDSSSSSCNSTDGRKNCRMFGFHRGLPVVKKGRTKEGKRQKERERRVEMHRAANEIRRAMGLGNQLQRDSLNEVLKKAKSWVRTVDAQRSALLHCIKVLQRKKISLLKRYKLMISSYPYAERKAEVDKTIRRLKRELELRRQENNGGPGSTLPIRMPQPTVFMEMQKNDDAYYEFKKILSSMTILSNFGDVPQSFKAVMQEKWRKTFTSSSILAPEDSEIKSVQEDNSNSEMVEGSTKESRESSSEERLSNASPQKRSCDLSKETSSQGSDSLLKGLLSGPLMKDVGHSLSSGPTEKNDSVRSSKKLKVEPMPKKASETAKSSSTAQKQKLGIAGSTYHSGKLQRMLLPKRMTKKARSKGSSKSMNDTSHVISKTQNQPVASLEDSPTKRKIEVAETDGNSDCEIIMEKINHAPQEKNEFSGKENEEESSTSSAQSMSNSPFHHWTVANLSQEKGSEYRKLACRVMSPGMYQRLRLLRAREKLGKEPVSQYSVSSSSCQTPCTSSFERKSSCNSESTEETLNKRIDYSQFLANAAASSQAQVSPCTEVYSSKSRQLPDSSTTITTEMTVSGAQMSLNSCPVRNVGRAADGMVSGILPHIELTDRKSSQKGAEPICGKTLVGLAKPESTNSEPAMLDSSPQMRVSQSNQVCDSMKVIPTGAKWHEISTVLKSMASPAVDIVPPSSSSNPSLSRMSLDCMETDPFSNICESIDSPEENLVIAETESLCSFSETTMEPVFGKAVT